MEKCFKISGRVQGVGFRFWTVRKVLETGGVSGYVCNYERDVLVLLNGEEKNLNTILLYLYKGPLFARVDNVSECPDLKVLFPPVENGVFKRI